MTGTWATGWATADVVTAAEFKKGVGAIFDSTLGGTAANIDVTSISATYAHLMITIYARGDVAAVNTTTQMRFNGDVGTNYDYQLAQGSAAVVSASETLAGTSLQAGWCAGNTAGANLFAATKVVIPHYAGSTNNKQFVSFSSLKTGTSTGNLNVIMLGGSWRSNAAINQITFLPLSGSFVTGTRLTIHALGA